MPYTDYDMVEKEHLIISSRREAGNAVFRVIDKEPPHENATAIQPSIEDGYMAVINGVIQ